MSQSANQLNHYEAQLVNTVVNNEMLIVNADTKTSNGAPMSQFVQLFARFSDNVVSYGMAIFTSGKKKVVAAKCVVCKCKPKNTNTMTIIEKEGLFYCLVSEIEGRDCNFAAEGESNYGVYVHGGNHIITSNELKAVPIAAPAAWRATPGKPAVVATPANVGKAKTTVAATPTKAKPEPQLSGMLAQLYDDFCYYGYKYITIEINGPQGKKKVTLHTPYTDQTGNCNRGSLCRHLSCTSHDDHERHIVLNNVATCNWKKEDVHSVMKGSAKVLSDAYLRYVNGERVDWNDIMKKALLAINLEGSSYSINH